ncbi:MAG: lysostaphin resistance A-like protein [Acidimicrobiales bacterium]
MAQPGDNQPSAEPSNPMPEPGRAPPPAGRGLPFPGPPPGYPVYPSSGTQLAPPPPAGEGTFLDQPGAPPPDRRTAGQWILLALLGYVVGQFVASIFTLVAATAAGRVHDLTAIGNLSEPPQWYIAASLVGLWVGFFLGPLVASKVRGTGRMVADFGLRFRPSDLLGIVVGVGGQYLIAALYLPFHVKNLTAPAQKLTGAAHGWGFLVVAVLTVVGAPFFEELFFRGLVLRALVRLFTPAVAAWSSPGARRSIGRSAGLVAAVVVDGLVFGLAHWERSQFAGLALFGMALAVVSYRTRRQGMNMVAHASFNLVAVLALLSSRGGVILH